MIGYRRRHGGYVLPPLPSDCVGDSAGNITLSCKGAVAGSGIRPIQVDRSVSPGNVALIAPMDREPGDAGTRVESRRQDAEQIGDGYSLTHGSQLRQPGSAEMTGNTCEPLRSRTLNGRFVRTTGQGARWQRR